MTHTRFIRASWLLPQGLRSLRSSQTYHIRKLVKSLIFTYHKLLIYHLSLRAYALGLFLCQRSRPREILPFFWTFFGQNKCQKRKHIAHIDIIDTLNTICCIGNCFPKVKVSKKSNKTLYHIDIIANIVQNKFYKYEVCIINISFFIAGSARNLLRISWDLIFRRDR